MSRKLDVYLYNYLVGNLIQNEHGEMVFDYTESWLQNPAVVPLSQSLPLRKEQFTRRECRGFFAGILPEQGNRELIAKNLGISARNDFAMLEQIGGECAGAVTFMPAGEKLPEPVYSYRPVSDRELEKILKELPQRPLLAGEDGVRLSLAGAQDKIAVAITNDGISVPLGNAPSTHIIKPAISKYEGLVFNEAFCMKLAAAAGLFTAAVEIRKVGNIDYLLVSRYDRKIQNDRNGKKIIERLHQEDFCQALAIPPELKYQNEGGPSLKQCFELIREVSSAAVIDLQSLLEFVIFNYLVGNHDAHGKNFSLLHVNYSGNDPEGLPGTSRAIRLAPLYDVVCTAYYPSLSKKMAMKIGGEYDGANIYPHHFERLAEECQLAKPLVKKKVKELASRVLKSLNTIEPPDKVSLDVKEFVRKKCEHVVRVFK